MAYLFWLVFWTIVSYFIAKKTKEQYPDLEIYPVNYAIGSLVIGALFCLPFLFFKTHRYLKNKAK